MPLRLDARQPEFERAFRSLLAAKREVSEDVDEAVRVIIDDVVARGDEAVIAYSRRFDGLDLTPDTLRVSEAELDAAFDESAHLALRVRQQYDEGIFDAPVGRVGDVRDARQRIEADVGEVIA